MAVMYYEEGTGSYGDGNNILFLLPPGDDHEQDVLADDDAVWEFVNAAESVSLSEIAEVLREARARIAADEFGPSNTDRIDSILAIIDPDD